MIRTTYILFISFAMAFLFQTNAADGVVEMADHAVKNGAEYLTQDNSPFLFAYWDKHARTTLTEFRDQNRQPAISSILINPVSIGFSYVEFSPLVTENYIVTLRKFRI